MQFKFRPREGSRSFNSVSTAYRNPPRPLPGSKFEHHTNTRWSLAGARTTGYRTSRLRRLRGADYKSAPHAENTNLTFYYVVRTNTSYVVRETEQCDADEEGGHRSRAG